MRWEHFEWVCIKGKICCSQAICLFLGLVMGEGQDREELSLQVRLGLCREGKVRTIILTNGLKSRRRLSLRLYKFFLGMSGLLREQFDACRGR